MKKDLTLFLILFIAFVSSSFGQQLPIYTQYNAVHGILNPASMRTDFHLNQGDYQTFAGASYRMHWQGISNENNTQAIHFEKVIPNEGVALFYGGHITNDKNGRIGNTGVYGRIGGIINDDLDWGGLAFGLNIGMVQYRVNMKDPKVRNPDDPSIEFIDPIIHPDVGLGAYFFKKCGFDHDDIIYVGLSIPQLFQLDKNKKEELIYLAKTAHFYSKAGYILTGNDAYSFFELSGQFYYTANAPLFYSVNTKYQFENVFWLGLGYGAGAVCQLEGGLLLGYERLFKLGASIDIPFNAYKPVYGSSFELNLLMAFGD